MNASRAALLVVGINLLAVWAAAAAGGRTAAPAAPPQVAADAAVGEARSSLLAAAERLEAHARRNPPPAMGRNPFRFAGDGRPVTRRAPGGSPPGPTADAPACVLPAVEPEPDIVLRGMELGRLLGERIRIPHGLRLALDLLGAFTVGRMIVGGPICVTPQATLIAKILLMTVLVVLLLSISDGLTAMTRGGDPLARVRESDGSAA